MATSLTSIVHEADDLNTCAVCFEKFDRSDRIPKYLICLHTFCISCLGKMLLDSFNMTISCPACRKVTSPTSGLASLRTNEHALRVLELEEKIINLNNPNISKSPAWCHTCDELASAICSAVRHSTTPLVPEVKEEANLSQNQMNKICLNLSYALGRRMEVDSYLKSIKQSISILDKHVAQLKDDNLAQINLVEGILQDLDQSGKGKSIRENNQQQQQTRRVSENEADSAYSSALSLAQTFEGAKNVLISMNVETVDGKEAPCLPWLNRIKLCLMNQIDEKAINAAGLNTLAFILLLQLQQQNRQQQITVSAVTPIPSTSSTPNVVHRSPLPLLPTLTANQYCFIEVELRNRRSRLIFQIVPHVSAELRNSFIRGFQATQANYFQSVVVKAGISLFVVLGSPYTSRSPHAIQAESAYHQRPWISQRGDVGLYCSNGVHHNGVSDLVILLAPFAERNVRRAPLVAHLIDGIEFCNTLSHLKLNERSDARVINCGVLNS